jgi:hypothetical protein
MSQKLQSVLWTAAGFLLLVAALFIPGHFRALDFKSVQYAAKGTPNVVGAGLNLVNFEQVSVARLFLKTAQMLKVPDTEILETAINTASRNLGQRSAAILSDAAVPIPELWSPGVQRPVIDSLLQRETQQKVMAILQSSPRPGVREILKTRTLTNLVQFAPASSVAGQPLDAAISLIALLSQSDRLSPRLRDEFETLSYQANTNEAAGSLEDIWVDMLALGQTLDWNQLAELLRRTERTHTIHALLESSVGATTDKFTILYTAALISERPALLAEYLEKFPKTGYGDVETALRFGKGAVVELLVTRKPIYFSRWRLKMIEYDPFGLLFYSMIPSSISAPLATALLRWTLFLAAGFCYARAIGTLALPWHIEAGERVDTTRIAQEATIAACIFVVAAVTTEPFLMPGQIKPPSAKTGSVLSGVIPIKIPKAKTPVMTNASLTPLLIFFGLQALLYIWSLAKLAEIRRQPVGARIKLRLLENEDHLFDAGLYLGFAGTVISLILVSLGVIAQSIMAAYASTSFGIIFVSILKICHIRPLRRHLILESEEQVPTEQLT